MQRLVLTKTKQEDRDRNDKLPYFKLSIPPTEEGGEWIDVAAFWKAKSGNGYSGKTSEGIVITFDPAERAQWKRNREASQGGTRRPYDPTEND